MRATNDDVSGTFGKRVIQNFSQIGPTLENDQHAQQAQVQQQDQIVQETIDTGEVMLS